MVEKYDSWEYRHKRTIKMYPDVEYRIEISYDSNSNMMSVRLVKHTTSSYRSVYIEQMEFNSVEEAEMVLEEIKLMYEQIRKEFFGNLGNDVR